VLDMNYKMIDELQQSRSLNSYTLLRVVISGCFAKVP
jgi:hypothetical protein